MTDVPLAAFSSAAEACPFINGDALRRALEAAAPHLTAAAATAERDRIRQLAITSGAYYPDARVGTAWQPFADLLLEDAP